VVAAPGHHPPPNGAYDNFLKGGLNWIVAWEENMNRTVACILALGLCGTAQAAELRQGGSRPDGSQPGPAATARTAAATARRYFVPYFSSITGQQTATVTVITILNPTSRSCHIKLNWFKGFTPDSLQCSINAVVDPGVSFDFCSRDTSESITFCNATCSPELTFDEGKAIVLSTPSEDCAKILADVRVYYTTNSDTGVTAISNTNIFRAR
jgi:hypothetical protein